MFLIADSGFLKTDWRLIDSQRNIYQYTTGGFNSYFHDIQTIITEIKENLLPKIELQSLESINSHNMHLYFYGAGCCGEEKCKLLKDALQQIFPQAVIEVEHNLLGAARALHGKNKGLITILDAGSNSCYYNGDTIEENNISPGYILGDEGSGAYIGKLFIQDYLNNEMPERIAKDFYRTYKLTKESIYQDVYKKTTPGKFLTSFSKFIYRNQNEKYINNLLVFSFNQFFDKHIRKYPNYQDLKMNCAGSIAYYYSAVLRKVASEINVKIDKIVESPISSLTLYHLQQECMLPPSAPFPVNISAFGEINAHQLVY